MAIADLVTARELGRAYADAIRGEAAASRLWVSAHGDSVGLWLLTQPIDADAERRLYGATAMLHHRLLERYFRFHLLNPRMFEELVLEEEVPKEAEEVPL